MYFTSSTMPAAGTNAYISPAPPPAQPTPTRIKATPIIVMIVPVTTAGNSRSTYLTKGATASPNRPPTMTAP